MASHCTFAPYMFYMLRYALHMSCTPHAGATPPSDVICIHWNTQIRKNGLLTTLHI